MFEIRVNNQTFTLWEDASVTRSIDKNSGRFQFSSSSLQPRDYPVKAGDFVQVIIDGFPVLTGYVDELNASISENSHTVTCAGRDVTQDLIDSSLPDSVKFTEGASLKSLCEGVISALGLSIKVFDQSGGVDDFSADDLEAAESGKTAMGYLTDFARKRQVYLISDGNQGLLIFRPGQQKATTRLVQRVSLFGNNIKTSSAKFSHQDRFGRYITRSQDNYAFDDDADQGDAGTDRSGFVEDEQIRKTRILEVNAEESMTDEECDARAKEEANIRRARSTEYSCVVATATQDNGSLWDIGQLVSIDDEQMGIRGTFLIREVTYMVSISDGTTTKIVCAPPDAYNVQGSENKSDKRRAKQSPEFQNQTPPPVERFRRRRNL